MAELREYKIVHVDNSGKCLPNRPGTIRDFNELITEGWEIDRVLVWDPTIGSGAKGGFLLFSRPRAGDYQPPHHAAPGVPRVSADTAEVTRRRREMRS